MEKHKLTANKRTVSGRKVKQLRKQGFLPANLYGKKIKSQSVQVALKDFSKTFHGAGETGLVELTIEGKKLPVLIHNLQYHPVTDQILHADFYQVDLKEKISAKVPLEIVGESPAVKDKLGVLLNILSEIEVEALPADLPEKIKIDIHTLDAVDKSIKVGDLKLDEKIKILSDQSLEVVKIATLVSKEAEKLVAEQAAASQAQAAEAPTAEGGKEEEKPGEAPAEKPAVASKDNKTEKSSDKG